MARLPRVYVEGAVYYISCRAAYNEKLFKTEKDYKMYLELLEKYREEYKFRLFAYVLLPEHLHLLIELSPDTEISDIMHSLNTAYSKYFNSYYNRRGHLFRERFRACIVEKEGYLENVIEHIHKNPVRLRISGNADGYPYSSIHLYNNDKNTRYEEIKEAISYIEQRHRGIPEERKDKELDLRKRLHRGGVLGSKEFKRRVKEEIQKSKGINKDSKRGKNHVHVVEISLGAIALLVFLAGIVKYLDLWHRSIPEKSKEESISAVPVTIKEIKDLNNTEWTVKFTSRGERKSFPDTLSFIDGKFVSAWFHQDGFKPTNYSVTQSSNKIIWETMQTSGNTTISWRGEIESNKMRGIASLRSESKSEDFSFISISLRRKK